MKIKNLKELIKKVEVAEQNITDLNDLMLVNKNNKQRSNYHCGFFVTGHNDKYVKVIDEDNTEEIYNIDEDILFEAVIAMIKRTEELNAKDKQVIEAMELMVAPEVKPQQQAPMPMQAPVQTAAKKY